MVKLKNPTNADWIFSARSSDIHPGGKQKATGRRDTTKIREQSNAIYLSIANHSLPP